MKVITDTKPRGRPRVEEPGWTVSTWIPLWLNAKLEQWSKETGRSFSDLIREVILDELDTGDGVHERARFAASRTHVYVGGPPPIRLRRMQFNHETRARRLGISWEMVDLRRVYAQCNGVCGICWQSVSFDEFTLDHIVPVSRGGSHRFGNLQVAHHACNSAKGAR